MNTDHFHSLGKFLLAFTAFWAYVAFSQFMLIWIANVPEEVPWYILRIQGGWRAVGAVPGAVPVRGPVLPAHQQGDHPRTRAGWPRVAAWMLLVHWIDLYWVLMPHLDPRGPRPSLWDLAAFVGVGGLAVAFGLLRMRGTAAVPIRDPYLEDSLRYTPQ